MGGGHFQEFEDEYLETLYDFHEKLPGQRVRNGDLAKYLDVSPASATEMVQRLAKNGFVDYVPYKGAFLTPKGFEHGMMMKRRHRLAEVLLTLLPFEGDVHETACRLEHAFDDDLEVCISLLLGNPKFDPSGRDIPPPNSRISDKIEKQNDFVSLKKLQNNQSGEVIILMTSSDDSKVLENIGISIGQTITHTDAGYICQNSILQISEELSDRIILRCISEE
ncbi:MAG: metal-dependent transcriptional regulator [Candidatus Poseidoniaceae archaeon]